MDITDTISLGLLTRDFEEPFWPRLSEACVVQHSCFFPSGSLTDSVLQWFLLAETSAQSDVEAMRTVRPDSLVLQPLFLAGMVLFSLILRDPIREPPDSAGSRLQSRIPMQRSQSGGRVGCGELIRCNDTDVRGAHNTSLLLCWMRPKIRVQTLESGIRSIN
jgi:hypothetical protein